MNFANSYAAISKQEKQDDGARSGSDSQIECQRRIQNAGDGINTQDIPFRFLNCMVAGLAYYLSIKLPNVPPDRIAMLKADYEQQFQLAAEEDREKAPIRFIPRQTFLGIK